MQLYNIPSWRIEIFQPFSSMVKFLIDFFVAVYKKPSTVKNFNRDYFNLTLASDVLA